MRYTGVLKEISDLKMLVAAYERIKSKPGSMTPGVDGETLDGYSLKTLQEISDSLRDESYQCKPSRRVYIPKPNGKSRPLGIPSINDRIVQESGRMVLEIIFEPHFMDDSHGYRPKRSCHTALKQMNTWNGIH